MLFITALTTLYLGMRAVMMIGGSCADGGPYISARPCPKNVGWLMPLSVWVGFGAAAWYFYARSKFTSGPDWGLLFWSALFISLGYNFFEFGFYPPNYDGLLWGNIICAIVFFLMGGAPLFFFNQSLTQVNNTSLTHLLIGKTSEPQWGMVMSLHILALVAGISIGRLLF